MLDRIGAFLATTPWAITPAMLDEIHRIYDLHAEGKTPDIKAIEAQLGRPLDNKAPKEYETVNGVALVPMSGVIMKRADIFTQISGGCGIEGVASMFKQALGDPQVRGIILVVDSPGGTIDGIFEFADFIFQSRDDKPCAALAYGCAASAAYLIAAACSKVYASDIATEVGSIGVVFTHHDRSEQDAKSGVKKTEIYRGKYKRMVPNGPLTEEAVAHIEGKVDYYFTLFVDEVARFRGVSPETVLSAMSTEVNDLFIGDQAVAAGLIDGIVPLDTLIEQVSAPSSQRRPGVRNQGTSLKSSKEETAMPDKNSMTMAELVAAYPEFAAQLRAEGAKSVDLGPVRTEAATAERDKVLGLITVALGDEQGARIAALVNASTPAEQLKAFRAIEAAKPAAAAPVDSEEEKKTKAELLAALKKSGAEAVGADAGAAAAAAAGKDYLSLIEEHMATHPKCTKIEAMQAVSKAHPDAHKAFVRAANKGKEVDHAA